MVNTVSKARRDTTLQKPASILIGLKSLTVAYATALLLPNSAFSLLLWKDFQIPRKPQKVNYFIALSTFKQFKTKNLMSLIYDVLTYIKQLALFQLVKYKFIPNLQCWQSPSAHALLWYIDSLLSALVSPPSQRKVEFNNISTVQGNALN